MGEGGDIALNFEYFHIPAQLLTICHVQMHLACKLQDVITFGNEIRYSYNQSRKAKKGSKMTNFDDRRKLALGRVENIISQIVF